MSCRHPSFQESKDGGSGEEGGEGEGVRRSREVQRPLKYVKEHSAFYGVMGSVEDSEKWWLGFDLGFP